MDMEIDKEENTEHVIIARIGNESENKVVEKQNRKTCDINIAKGTTDPRIEFILPK